MKESVKNFIEKNILALEEEDIVLFLYLAFVQLSVALHYRRKVQLSTLVDTLPHFNYKDYTEFRNTVVNAIRKVYPNKVVLPDSYGIEYVIERI